MRADRLAKGIYWDVSVNDQTGCSKDGREGCARCWAERFSVRLEAMGKPQYAGSTCNGKWSGKIQLWPQAQDRVLGWKKHRVIFWNDMSDPFKAPFSHIDRKMAIIALTPQHSHLMLTKQPERMKEYFEYNLGVVHSGCTEARIGAMAIKIAKEMGEDTNHPYWDAFFEWPIPNLVVGVSVWDQPSADRMIPILLQTNLATRIVSFEPALKAVDFMYPKSLYPDGPPMCCNGADCGCMGIPIEPPLISDFSNKIDGIIMGGESGPKPRPMELDWAFSVMNQCYAASVPLFIKQLHINGKLSRDMGEWPAALRVRDLPEVM